MSDINNQQHATTFSEQEQEMEEGGQETTQQVQMSHEDSDAMNTQEEQQLPIYQQPMQHPAYLQPTYNAQGQMIMPGIQVISTGKPYQQGQIPQMMQAVHGKPVVQGQQAQFPGYAIPTSKNNPSVVHTQFGVLGQNNYHEQQERKHSGKTRLRNKNNGTNANIRKISRQQDKAANMNNIVSQGQTIFLPQIYPFQYSFNSQQPQSIPQGAQSVQFAPWQPAYDASGLPQGLTWASGTIPGSPVMTQENQIYLSPQHDQTGIFIQAQPSQTTPQINKQSQRMEMDSSKAQAKSSTSKAYSSPSIQPKKVNLVYYNNNQLREILTRPMQTSPQKLSPFQIQSLATNAQSKQCNIRVKSPDKLMALDRNPAEEEGQPPEEKLDENLEKSQYMEICDTDSVPCNMSLASTMMSPEQMKLYIGNLPPQPESENPNSDQNTPLKGNNLVEVEPGSPENLPVVENLPSEPQIEKDALEKCEEISEENVEPEIVPENPNLESCQKSGDFSTETIEAERNEETKNEAIEPAEELKDSSDEESENKENELRSSNDKDGAGGVKATLRVKPQVFTHAIEGVTDPESPEPYPTNFIIRKVTSNAEIEESDDASKRTTKKRHYATCETCGKKDLKSKFKKSKRFCSKSCVKRFNAGCHPKIGLFKSSKNEDDASGQEGECSNNEIPFPVESKNEETKVFSVSDDLDKGNPCRWSVTEVCEFIRNLPGCAEYVEDFASQDIDGQALLLLKPYHLMSVMSMKLGPAIKIIAKIERIKNEIEQTLDDVTDDTLGS